MSKINRAIYEIEHMSQLAQRDQWVNNIHPLVKLFISFFYILTVVSFGKYNLTGTLSMAIYPIFSFAVCELSWRDAFHRMRVVIPVVCIVGIFNPFFDINIVTYIVNLAVSGGVISMLSLMIKGVLTVLASYILIATTPIERICYGLRCLHVPKIFVTEIMLIFRYIVVLLEEVRRLTQAYSLRAPGQKGIHFKAWGSLTGQLLLRSMDRAEGVYESMCLRGYKGEYAFSVKSTVKAKDILYGLIWAGIFAVLRLFPVFDIVGGLFV